MRSLLLVCVATSVGAAQSGNSTLAAKVDSLCQPLIAAEIAVGFVVGVIDGETTLVRGYGRLAPGRDGAPDGDTIYEIGSISKVFTALLLADAVERGEVSLDDPVRRFLPESVTMPAVADQPVLLWHLATHSSGLPRMPPDFAPAEPRDPYADFDAAKLYASLAAIEVKRAPEAAYEYSNLAAGLLGHVLVLAARADSYEALLQQRICRPLGLESTRVVLDESLRARLAPPHDGDGGMNASWGFDALAGAGGIRSTVHDLLRFMRAQLDPAGTPLAAAIGRSQEKRSTAKGGPAMALGWHFAADGFTLWHNGQTGGYHGFVGLAPSKGKAVCLLTNSATGEVDAVAERVLQHVFGMPVEPPKFETPVAVDRDVLAQYAGDYRMAPAMTFTIEVRPAGLFAQLTGQPSLRVYPRSPTEFFYRAVKASITFERDADGKVTKLVLHQNGRDIPCARIE